MAKQFKVDLIVSSILGGTQLDTQVALVTSPVWNRGVVRTPVAAITEQQVREEFEAQLEGIIGALREDFAEALALRFPPGDDGVSETPAPDPVAEEPATNSNPLLAAAGIGATEAGS